MKRPLIPEQKEAYAIQGLANLLEAVRSGSLSDVRREAMDIAVGCLHLILSIDEGCCDW